MSSQASTVPDYVTTEHGTVLLGKTTYRVETQEFGPGAISDDVTWLYGPRGAVYRLVPLSVRGTHTGICRVVSFSTGAPLRVAGNEVRVVAIGDVIEVAPR